MEEEIYVYDDQDGTFNIFYLIAKYTLLFLTVTVPSCSESRDSFLDYSDVSLNLFYNRFIKLNYYLEVHMIGLCI